MARHTLHIRNVDEELYETMWNLRKYYNARSWCDLLRKICKEYEKKIEEEVWY